MFECFLCLILSFVCDSSLFVSAHALEYSKYWFGEDAKVETDPSVKEAQIEYTKYLFIQALKVDPDDTHTLYQYANFFYHAGQYDLAEVCSDRFDEFCERLFCSFCCVLNLFDLLLLLVFRLRSSLGMGAQIADC